MVISTLGNAWNKTSFWRQLMAIEMTLTFPVRQASTIGCKMSSVWAKTTKHVSKFTNSCLFTLSCIGPFWVIFNLSDQLKDIFNRLKKKHLMQLFLSKFTSLISGYFFLISLERSSNSD